MAYRRGAVSAKGPIAAYPSGCRSSVISELRPRRAVTGLNFGCLIGSGLKQHPTRNRARSFCSSKGRGVSAARSIGVHLSPLTVRRFNYCRNRKITSASRTLIPLTCAISAGEALRSRSSEPKCFRSACLRFSLTPGQSSRTLSATRFFMRS
jgi:hypothetical protein